MSYYRRLRERVESLENNEKVNTDYLDSVNDRVTHLEKRVEVLEAQIHFARDAVKNVYEMLHPS